MEQVGLTLIDFAVDSTHTLAACIANGASMYVLSGGLACQEELYFWNSVAKRFVGQSPSELIAEASRILRVSKITTWTLKDDSSDLTFDRAFFESDASVAGREFAIVHDEQEERYKLLVGETVRRT
jgi:hypothetical protein